MSLNFEKVIAIFTCYFIFLLMTCLLTHFKFITHLRAKLIQIRLLLKIIPSEELLKKKVKLEKI